MGTDRLGRLTRKMTPGTFGGQSRAAQPPGRTGQLQSRGGLVPGCPCVAGRFGADNIALEKGATEFSNFALVEQYATGGVAISGGASIYVPEDGLYNFFVRVYVVLDSIDAGTVRIPVDCFDLVNMANFNDVVYIDADRTFAFLKGAMMIQLAAGNIITPRVRLGAVGTLAGDSVSVESPYFAIHKICSCDDPAPGGG